MLETNEKNAKPASIVKPLPATKAEVICTYGGYPFSNPEQDREKILVWFSNHFALSDEQAVRELQIGNLSKRMSELRQIGYVIHSQRYLAEVTAAHEYHSMVYALHRGILHIKKMPNPYCETKVWIQTVNILLQSRAALVDLNSNATAGGDIFMFARLFQKMQAKCLGFM